MKLKRDVHVKVDYLHLEKIKGEKMKNLKSYIIGFLTATCLFLFMGFNNGENTPSISGKYQIAGDMMNGLYLVDSQTGKILYWKRTSGWDYLER